MSGSEAAVSLDSIMSKKILPRLSTPQLPDARFQGLGPLSLRNHRVVLVLDHRSGNWLESSLIYLLDSIVKVSTANLHTHSLPLYQVL